jgi:sec-independent protein translocase protein TatA
LKPHPQKQTIFDSRVFSQDSVLKAGVTVVNFDSLDAHPELVILRGQFDKRIDLTKNQKNEGNHMFGIGMQEMIVVLVIVLIIFGAGKLPEIGGGIGKAIRNFRQATREDGSNTTDHIEEKKNS